MMNHTNRFASPGLASSLGRMAAKGILLLTGVALLAGCVEQPPPRRVYQAPPSPPPRTDVYAYPTQGQTPEQTDRDRYDCHEWAVKQTNFDPSAPGTPPHDRGVVAAGPPPAVMGWSWLRGRLPEPTPPSARLRVRSSVPSLRLLAIAALVRWQVVS